MVISSTGPATRIQTPALCLGVFDFNTTIEVFQQRANISISDDPRYLSQSNETNNWLVGKPIGKGWLLNNNKSSSIPTNEWQYKDDTVWPKDNSIIIHAGDLVPCPAVTIKVDGGAAEKWPTCCNGVFRFNNQWVWGRPVYFNEDGHMLFLGSSGKWLVGSKYGKYWIKSTSGPLLPINTIFWTYWDGETDRVAEVVISCT